MFYLQVRLIILLSRRKKEGNMENLEYDEQEYIRFMIKLSNKANEIAKEYNKLSDKNKYRFQVFLEEMVKVNIMIRTK